MSVLAHLEKSEQLALAKTDLATHYRAGRAWLLNYAHRMDEEQWGEELSEFCARACPGDEKTALRLERAIIWGVPPE